MVYVNYNSANYNSFCFSPNILLFFSLSFLEIFSANYNMINKIILCKYDKQITLKLIRRRLIGRKRLLKTSNIYRYE